MSEWHYTPTSIQKQVDYTHYTDVRAQQITQSKRHHGNNNISNNNDNSNSNNNSECGDDREKTIGMTTTGMTTGTTTPLEDALKRDALQAFAHALHDVQTAPEHAHAGSNNNDDKHKSNRTLLAVDASLHVILQVLAHGAGGKAFYDDLGVARLVKIDVATMDAQTIQASIASRNSNMDPVVFIVPPRPTTAKLIADSVRSLEGARRCSVLWLPAATSECALEMERQGVCGFVAQRNFSLGLAPVDRGVVALCRDAIFGELFVRGDHRALTDVVKSLLAIERHTGARMLDVVAHGTFAERVKRMLALAHRLRGPSDVSSSSVSSLPQHYQQQQQWQSASVSGGGGAMPGAGVDDSAAAATRSRPIDKVILIDRMQDPLSMLLTPMTYEGLLDALLDVNHGVVSYAPATKSASSSAAAAGDTRSTGSVDANAGATSAAAQPAPPPTSTTTVLLNHRDELFGDIRDTNFNVLVAHHLAAIAQDLVTQARLPSAATTATPAESPVDSRTSNNNSSNSSTSTGAGISTSTSAPPSATVTTLAHVTALLQRVPQLVKTKQSLAHHLHLVHEIRARSSEFALRGCVETEMAVLSASKRVAQDADRFLEEALLRDPPLQLHDVAKLLCLCSLVRGGLKPEMMSWYRRQLCHTYGYAAVLPLLVQLEKLGLLSAATASAGASRAFDFPSAKKQFALLSGALEDDATLAPRDVTFMFPYTGYAPLSVRLVQDALGLKYKSSALSGLLPTSTRGGASASASTLSMRSTGSSSSSTSHTSSASHLTGAGAVAGGGGGMTATASAASSDSVWSVASSASEQQTQHGRLDISSSSNNSNNSGSSTSRQATVLVYYIGGVTVAELAAFRFLNQQHDAQFAFLVAATSVCNGSRLLRAIA